MSTPKLIGLRLDLETKSSTEIKFGSYVYSEDPDFDVLLIAYSPLRQFAGGAVKMGQPRLLDPDPKVNPRDWHQFRNILIDPGFQKHAFNANFERICLSKFIGLDHGRYIDPENWHCSAVRANVNGIFGSLDEIATAVRSPIKKDPEGKRLINLFSKPDRKTGKFHRFVRPGEPFEGRHCWCGLDHAADSLKYGEYCKQDVLTEAAVAGQVPAIPPHVQAEYEADQRINDRGVRHFKGLSVAAVEQVATEKDRVMGELKVLTGLDNPNSNAQMQNWLLGMDYPMVSLDKAHREEALNDPLIPETVAEVLTLKGQASMTSVTKHKAMLDTRCEDGRIRGSLRFYGAHTGREAGRGFQPQNLPRYEASGADRARLVRGTAGADAPQIAKGTVRSALVPAKGHVFIVPDYNAIEARCLGWQCGETWVQREFDTASGGQGKIYEATAATMFNIDKDALIAGLKMCGKCGTCVHCETRNKGKVSNLALGYAGGAGALVTMGAEEAGIDIGNYKELNALWVAAGSPGKFYEWNRDEHDYPELDRLRDLYRLASPATKSFWEHCERAWDRASAGHSAQFGNNLILTMMRDGKHNRLVLPSGRSIWYRFARSHENDKNPDRIDNRTYIGKSMGVGHRRTDTFGGRLTENITQAVARDVLFDLIMRIETLTKQGWPGHIVLHVHDEVVLEVPEKHADIVLADVLDLMSVPPDWAPGLAVQGAGSIMQRYGK